MGDGCLASQSDAQTFRMANHWELPLFALCRNVSCLETMYSTSNRARRYLPNLNVDARVAGALERVTHQHEAIAEIRSGALPSVRELSAAIHRRQPLILRGSAWDMPARKRWLDDVHLSAALGITSGSKPFWSMLNEEEGGGEDLSGPLAEQFLPDVRWPSAFSDALLNFSSGRPHVWASTGGKRAALHFDAVDNVHAVVAAEKDVVLVSPLHLTHLYVDFFDAAENYGGVQGELVCPSEADFRFGCDGFSCFGYSPVNAEHVDLARFPRVADAITYGPARLRDGDVLFIPAFWSHRLVHHPLDGGGRNIALSFVRRPGHRLSMDQMPFAPHIAQLQIKWEASSVGSSHDEL